MTMPDSHLASPLERLAFEAELQERAVKLDARSNAGRATQLAEDLRFALSLISTLRADNERLRALLRKTVEYVNYHAEPGGLTAGQAAWREANIIKPARAAAALGEKE